MFSSDLIKSIFLYFFPVPGPLLDAALRRNAHTSVRDTAGQTVVRSSEDFSVRREVAIREVSEKMYSERTGSAHPEGMKESAQSSRGGLKAVVSCDRVLWDRQHVERLSGPGRRKDDHGEVRVQQLGLRRGP